MTEYLQDGKLDEPKKTTVENGSAVVEEKKPDNIELQNPIIEVEADNTFNRLNSEAIVIKSNKLGNNRDRANTVLKANESFKGL